MKATDDRADKTLPVTNEVGSEGGSYADATHQVATFRGPADPTTSPADAVAGKLPIQTRAGVVGQPAGTGTGDTNDTASGTIRYPTEPPSPPDAREGRRIGSHGWGYALLGAAAGAATMLMITMMRRRRQ